MEKKKEPSIYTKFPIACQSLEDWLKERSDGDVLIKIKSGHLHFLHDKGNNQIFMFAED